MSQNLPKRSLRDFLSLRHPNHFALAGKNNRNVIITHRFLAAPVPQGPKEICLSLEHQNPSKSSEKWVISRAIIMALGYFDRVRSLFGRRAVCQRGYGLRLLIFKMANNKGDLGQIRSEEIVYSRFIKIPTGLINRAKRQV